ncbi:MAG: hypothetical protein ACRCS9_02885 [Hyphomicrobium sp.]
MITGSGFAPIITFIWPAVIATAAWAIVIWALRQPDENARLIAALTQSAKSSPKTGPAISDMPGANDAPSPFRTSHHGE